MKTQSTSSTFKLCVLPLEPAINTGCQLRSSDCHKENGGVYRVLSSLSNSAHFTFTEGTTVLCKQEKNHFRFVVSSYFRLKYS